MKYILSVAALLIGFSAVTLPAKNSNAYASFSVKVGSPVIYKDPYPSYPSKPRYEEVVYREAPRPRYEEIVYREAPRPRYREVAYERPRYEEVRVYERDRQCHRRHHGHRYGWWW